METIGTQNMLIKTFYNKYMENVIKQRMALIIAIIISITKIYLPSVALVFHE